MSDQDRVRWDRRYAERPPVPVDEAALPVPFQPFADIFPTAGYAIDLACGRGEAAVWLARRGIDVCGYDVSPVAIGQARALAQQCGVATNCRFEVLDLDNGLPAGDPADVVICNRFRDAALDSAIVERLAAGGLLAISALSEVDGFSGPFRAKAGELRQMFGGLEEIAGAEANGEAWLLARRR